MTLDLNCHINLNAKVIRTNERVLMLTKLIDNLNLALYYCFA